ncbi:MAG: NAD(P)H-hydrate epimerase [Actinomycetota bacterium]
MRQTRVIDADEVAWIDTEQMIEVDRVMIEDLHIELVQMMENAGRSLARLALDRFGTARPAVCVGPGGNGGGGLVAARHLANAGAAVTVVLAADRDRFAPVPAHQLDGVERMGVAIVDAAPDDPDLWVDAVIGYSLRGDPRERAARLIDAMNDSPAPVLSLDAPSGLDTATGRAATPAVRATATMTLALPKAGLRGQEIVGELHLADISVPPSVYEAMGVTPVSLGPGVIARIDGL